MLTKDKKILIVGLGLMGGSYAQALKRQGFTVDAITRSQGSIDYALERGWIDWGSTTVDPEELGTCDIVIFALYPNVLLRWLEDNQQYLKDGALLTDVTGIKGPVVYKVQAMLRPALEFVGAHPMAGREVYGVRNADCSIFQGANYIVTPTESNTPAAVETTEELGRLLGFARISAARRDDRIPQPAHALHSGSPYDLPRRGAPVGLHRRLVPRPYPYSPYQRRDVERAFPAQPRQVAGAD